MTVDASAIQAVYRGLSATDAATALTNFQTVAAVKLNRDIEGTDISAGDLYDHCHALLIAHYWASSDPTSSLRSYSSGDWSASQDPGRTIWLLQYEQIIGDGQVSDDDTSAVKRADAEMPEFNLDQNAGPYYFSEEV